MLLQLQQPQKAMDQYNIALTLMIPAFKPFTIDELPNRNDLYGENTLLDALHGKADCLRELNKKEKALECYMLLFATEKKLRREFFSNTARQQQQKENRQWAESAIETAFDLWKETGNPQSSFHGALRAGKKYADKLLLIAEMSKAQLLLDEMMNSMRYNRAKYNDTLLNREQQMLQAINFYEKEAIMNAANGKPDSNAIAAKKELQFDLSLLQKQVKGKYALQESLINGEDLPSVDSLLQNMDEATTIIEFFTGEKNITASEATQVFPNPVLAGEEITFNLRDARSIEIFDLAGRKLLSVDVQHQSTIKLSTKNFSSGLYVYQIQFNSKNNINRNSVNNIPVLIRVDYHTTTT